MLSCNDEPRGRLHCRASWSLPLMKNDNGRGWKIYTYPTIHTVHRTISYKNGWHSNIFQVAMLDHQRERGNYSSPRKWIESWFPMIPIPMFGEVPHWPTICCVHSIPGAAGCEQVCFEGGLVGRFGDLKPSICLGICFLSPFPAWEQRDYRFWSRFWSDEEYTGLFGHLGPKLFNIYWWMDVSYSHLMAFFLNLSSF